jgi:hypothetical protein
MKDILPVFLLIIGFIALVSLCNVSAYAAGARIYVFIFTLLGLGCTGSGIVLLIANAKYKARCRR